MQKGEHAGQKNREGSFDKQQQMIRTTSLLPNSFLSIK